MSPPRRICNPLSGAQRAVLEHLREHGSITPKQAGMLLYAVQGTPWREQWATYAREAA